VGQQDLRRALHKRGCEQWRLDLQAEHQPGQRIGRWL